MQSKKEAIEVLKAMIENAINCNPLYNVVVYHRKGIIRVIDSFGDTDLKYDETKKSAEKQETDSFRTKESYTAEIAANTDKIAHYLKDMRAMLTDHRIKEVLMESQCDHIQGTYIDGENGRTYLGNVSNNRPNFKYAKLFYFCPNCGNKLR